VCKALLERLRDFASPRVLAQAWQQRRHASFGCLSFLVSKGGMPLHDVSAYITALLTSENLWGYLHEHAVPSCERYLSWLLRHREVHGHLDEVCSRCLMEAQGHGKRKCHTRSSLLCMLGGHWSRCKVDQLISSSRSGAGARATSQLPSLCSFDTEADPDAVMVFVEKDDFSYRSVPHNEVAVFSRALGMAPWFRVGSFRERVDSMIFFFQARQLVLSHHRTGPASDVLRAEFVLHKRVNSADRRDTPSTRWIYAHYRAHIQSRLQEGGVPDLCLAQNLLLAEWLVNICLIRNTLSLRVRVDLRDGHFPWLLLGCSADGAVSVANLRELDVYYSKVDGDIFGTFVNPMRTRQQQGAVGYIQLLADVEAFAAQSLYMASEFVRTSSVQTLLELISAVHGYAGSGFRAKEVLCDFVDILLEGFLFKDLSVDRSMVQRDFHALSVIGVGPCRVVNYLYGQKFLANEDLDMAKKIPLYTPYLEHVASFIRAEHPAFSSWPNMSIYYMMCEYNKQLRGMYLNGGLTYIASSYVLVPFSDLTASSLRSVTALRTAASSLARQH
jgi:hypothetical protein